MEIYSRRDFIRIGASALAAAGLSCVNKKKDKSLEERVSFEEAKKDTSKRDEFVENLSEKLKITHYVKDFEYTTDTLAEGADNIYDGRKPAMSTSNIGGSYRDFGGKRIYSKTTIYPPAFDESKDGKEFLTKLMHEMNMAKIIYKGFDKIPMGDFYFTKNGKERFNSTLFHVAAELESYGKDVSHAIKHKLGNKKLNNEVFWYMFYYRMLWHGDNPSPEEKVENLKKVFRKKWMEKCSFFRRDEKGAYFLDEDRMYRLPEKK